MSASVIHICPEPNAENKRNKSSCPYLALHTFSLPSSKTEKEKRNKTPALVPARCALQPLQQIPSARTTVPNKCCPPSVSCVLHQTWQLALKGAPSSCPARVSGLSGSEPWRGGPPGGCALFIPARSVYRIKCHRDRFITASQVSLGQLSSPASRL